MSFLNGGLERVGKWDREGTYLVRGSCEVIRRGSGMQSIIMSEVRLKTALVIRWWMAAEH
jgi:hypothetical protein